MRLNRHYEIRSRRRRRPPGPLPPAAPESDAARPAYRHPALVRRGLVSESPPGPRVSGSRLPVTGKARRPRTGRGSRPALRGGLDSSETAVGRPRRLGPDSETAPASRPRQRHSSLASGATARRIRRRGPTTPRESRGSAVLARALARPGESKGADAPHPSRRPGAQKLRRRREDARLIGTGSARDRRVRPLGPQGGRRPAAGGWRLQSRLSWDGRLPPH